MSPAATITDDDAVGRLQQAADRLFYERGIVGVTVADVRDAAGVSLRRIYSICPSKADLVTLWLHHRHDAWMQTFAAGVAERLEAGVEPVDAVFDTVQAWLVETEFRGCGFINTRCETSELTDEHLEIIREHKRALAAHLDGLTGAGDALAVLVDGAIVHASIFSTTDPIDQARRTAHALVTTTGKALP